MFERLRYLVGLSNAHLIARRYFVTNGFDGVLTMLGLLMGFRVSGEASIEIMIGVCLAGAIALFMSGLTSAYISESAEKAYELRKLEKSMAQPLDESVHAEAAKSMPWIVALVNGISPLIFSLVILSPLFLAQYDLFLWLSPIDAALSIALVLSFLLGVFLGQFSGRSWLWSGVRALLICATTTVLILLIQQILGNSG